MKYIINKTLVFNTDEQTLALYENALIVTRLSKPAGRLLLEFIQHGQQIVSREELLTRVWTHHGFSASSAGLNNYISELRKAFVLLGCHQELIVTLPKKGFRFEADIQLDTFIAEEPQDFPREDEEKNPLPVAEVPDEVDFPKKSAINAARKSLCRKRITVSSVCIILIISGLYFYLGNNNKRYPYQKIATVDNCDIYAVGKTNDLSIVKNITNSILKREEINCTHDKNDVFYMENRLDKKNLVSDLISICKKDENDRYDTCLNIKKQRRTTK
ncbi:winged helix-turn-helix domain-containing protein [Serratia marcescens]|uniref:winged helix-turn-helix domain-containing protein n=1 Tax=Serratia marcescens TaxID=615 RepID=UPI00339C5006